MRLIVDDVSTQCGYHGVKACDCERSIGRAIVLAKVEDYNETHNNGDDVYDGCNGQLFKFVLLCSSY